ncbi:hypothetical protein DPEC_G00309660 [Dallia pectoralis]|uniref:Uncharacterized protein n=1 Tax=Dallia pectoralis TaxID=75939 RepID=A0ACC2FF20_DALPE|nr:hypothetical protein DPEC_G00309660 [Dallia pectoralis]
MHNGNKHCERPSASASDITLTGVGQGEQTARVCGRRSRKRPILSQPSVPDGATSTLILHRRRGEPCHAAPLLSSLSPLALRQPASAVSPVESCVTATLAEPYGIR